MRAMKTLHIHVIAITRAEDLHEDDDGLPGVYEVEVEDGFSEEDTRWAALEAFHQKNGIEVLDDFDIDVVDPETGACLSEGESEPEDDIHYTYNGKLSDEVPVPRGMFKSFLLPTFEDQELVSSAAKPHNCIIREFGSIDELAAYEDAVEAMEDLTEYSIEEESDTALKVDIDGDMLDLDFNTAAEKEAYKAGLDDADGFVKTKLVTRFNSARSFDALNSMFPDAPATEDDDQAETESPKG